MWRSHSRRHGHRKAAFRHLGKHSKRRLAHGQHWTVRQNPDYGRSHESAFHHWKEKESRQAKVLLRNLFSTDLRLRFTWVPRGEIFVKGKGMVKTYLLEEETNL